MFLQGKIQRVESDVNYRLFTKEQREQVIVSAIHQQDQSFLNLVVYEIEIADEGKKSVIRKRYSEILSFFQFLQQKEPFLILPHFPQKKFLHKFQHDYDYVIQRRNQLQKFFNRLCTNRLIDMDKILELLEESQQQQGGSQRFNGDFCRELFGLDFSCNFNDFQYQNLVSKLLEIEKVIQNLKVYFTERCKVNGHMEKIGQILKSKFYLQKQGQSDQGIYRENLEVADQLHDDVKQVKKCVKQFYQRIQSKYSKERWYSFRADFIDCNKIDPQDLMRLRLQSSQLQKFISGLEKDLQKLLKNCNKIFSPN